MRASWITIGAGALLPIIGSHGMGHAPPDVPVARVGVLDMARLTRDSALGKRYAARIDALQAELRELRVAKQRELDQRDVEIRSLQEAIERGSKSQSSSLDQSLQTLRGKQRERQAFFEDGQFEIGKLQDRIRDQAEGLGREFETEARPRIEAAARAEGIDVLLDSRMATAVNPAFDITPIVIVHLQQDDGNGPAPPSR